MNNVEEIRILTEMLDYDPVTGALTRRLKLRGNGAKPVGSLVPGFSIKTGHRYIQPFGRGCKYLHHRVAWMLMYGEWPDGEIDHVDHDPSNNAFHNLRKVDRTGNMQNTSRPKHNTSGLMNVSWVESRQGWRVQFSRMGRSIYHQFHDNLLDAAADRFRMRREFGFHDNHGAAS